MTTNFDRLLEHALQARGIEPVIVTSAADLASAPRREHAQSYVLKPHGDYLQETIRNTPSELAELDPEIAAELKEIFDRFGVAVLGYSGSDAGIGELLRARRSRYGLYWIARRDLGDGADRIVETTGGRVIKREGAAEFLADLRRRLDVFRSHPSGHTPIEVHDEILALIRSKDEIGLAEVMRRERRQFGDHLSEIIAGHREERPDETTLLQAHDQMLPVMERRLAGLLPLIAYDPASQDREIRSLIELLQDRPIVGGFTAWTELLDWATWWLGYVCGAFALFQEAWEPLKVILEARYSNWNDVHRFLVEPVRESVGQDLRRFVMARFSDTKWLVSRWEHLSWSVANSEVLKERWPEFLRGEEPKLPALLDFDLLVNVKFGLEEQQPLAHWGMYSGGGVRPARRLRNDPDYRLLVARLLVIEEEDFIDRVVAAGGRARSPEFLNSGALRILASGRD